MRDNIDAAFIAAVESETAHPVVFADLQFTTPHRVCDLDVEYYLGGERYISDELVVESLSMGSGLVVDRAKIKIGNANRVLSALLLGNNERGKWVHLHIGAIDADGQLIGYGTFFKGLLSNYEITDDSVSLDLVSWLVLWRKKTLRTAQANCPWPYGGSECGHTGSWCDQTYDRCQELANTDNFGGDPFLPALEEQPLYWGRSQK
jgi:hypothetical protein